MDKRVYFNFVKFLFGCFDDGECGWFYVKDLLRTDGCTATIPNYVVNKSIWIGNALTDLGFRKHKKDDGMVYFLSKDDLRKALDKLEIGEPEP